MLSPPKDRSAASTMRLYNLGAQRLYINAAERSRFLAAANRCSPEKRSFALTLLYTGCRLSEARELTAASLQLEAGLLSIRSLKKRDQHHVREVPIPHRLVAALADIPQPTSGPLWQLDGCPLSRITAYRWIKSVMEEATIQGPQATPKGLRHGYGIHAIRSGVPITLLQKWLGHAALRTTAVYTNALGPEEIEIAQRMW